MSDRKVSVLFVCMGNICRSPTAEGVFRHHVAEGGLGEAIDIDSAGTHAYHVGEAPDRRSQEAAERRGITLDDIRARRVKSEDFERFDLILAMDKLNHITLIEQADAEHHEKIQLFLEYAPGAELEVPDPYYGGAAGFERVLDMVEEASRGLLETLRSRHL
ncbi:MAG: low molecular weight protein-tyrosine-phosphatase [Woeseiaceae bacterium]|nr:low molecular weight protein-tyrosine-phosphatase [Woeseiaceae bacterium]